MGRKWVIRWGLVGLVMSGTLWLLARTVRDVPGAHSYPFERWYGNWRAVLIATGLFTLFLLGFSRPRRRMEWRNAGLYSAFLISLFTEMFGVPSPSTSWHPSSDSLLGPSESTKATSGPSPWTGSGCSLWPKASIW